MKKACGQRYNYSMSSMLVAEFTVFPKSFQWKCKRRCFLTADILYQCVCNV